MCQAFSTRGAISPLYVATRGSPRILSVRDLPFSQAVELQSLLEHENEGDEDEDGEDAAEAAAVEDAEAGKPRRVVLGTSVPLSVSV